VIGARIRSQEFEPGEQMPTMKSLADEIGVSKTTVEKAMDLLKAEGLVVTRQGAGTFVREPSTRPTGLRPHLEDAFEADRVSIDFYGFSGETLHGATTECLDKIRTGRYRPTSINIRLIVPDTTRPWPLPALADGKDSPRFRKRHAQTIDRYANGLKTTVEELSELGLITEGSVEIRQVGSPPTCKLYIVNRTQAFFGWYPVIRHKVTFEGTKLDMLDLMGKDTELFHFQTDRFDPTASLYVDQARDFFESQWSIVAQTLDP
jgi:DNA-binding transcriptional regulator YhcF (GntR family)